MDTDIISAARKHDRVPKACALPEGERRRTRSQLPFRVILDVFDAPRTRLVDLDNRTSTLISGTSESCHYEISGGRSRRGFSCYRPMIV